MNKVLFVLFSGIILITLALCADAMIGNVQEKAMKTYSSTNTEVVR
jgi:adenosine 3'-phospho 5'-phosphosulfate transporter B3